MLCISVNNYLNMYCDISMCILISRCVYWYLDVYTDISMCKLLSRCVNYYLYMSTTISQRILTFSMFIILSQCVYYYIYVYSTISMCSYSTISLRTYPARYVCVYITISMDLPCLHSLGMATSPNGLPIDWRTWGRVCARAPVARSATWTPGLCRIKSGN